MNYPTYKHAVAAAEAKSRTAAVVNTSYHPSSIIDDRLNIQNPLLSMIDNRTFDALSENLATDNLMLMAQSWGCYRKWLYTMCRRLGYERVRAAVKEVCENPHIVKRGIYLNKVLQSMA